MNARSEVKNSREVGNPLFIHEIWGASLKPPPSKTLLREKISGEGKLFAIIGIDVGFLTWC